MQACRGKLPRRPGWGGRLLTSPDPLDFGLQQTTEGWAPPTVAGDFFPPEYDTTRGIPRL